MLDERHPHVADDDLVLPEPAFELGASAPPILQIDFLRHHFKNYDVVIVGLTAFPPKTLGRGLQIGRDALEISRRASLTLSNSSLLNGRPLLSVRGSKI